MARIEAGEIDAFLKSLEVDEELEVNGPSFLNDRLDFSGNPNSGFSAGSQTHILFPGQHAFSVFDQLGASDNLILYPNYADGKNFILRKHVNGSDFQNRVRFSEEGVDFYGTNEAVSVPNASWAFRTINLVSTAENIILLLPLEQADIPGTDRPSISGHLLSYSSLGGVISHAWFQAFLQVEQAGEHDSFASMESNYWSNRDNARASLVTVTYSGTTWIAIRMTSDRNPNALYYTGLLRNPLPDTLRRVAAGDVSDVQDFEGTGIRRSHNSWHEFYGGLAIHPNSTDANPLELWIKDGDWSGRRFRFEDREDGHLTLNAVQSSGGPGDFVHASRTQFEDWVWLNSAGANLRFSTDENVRTLWDVRRNSMGDGSPTGRLWQMRVRASDDLDFISHTGGVFRIQGDAQIQGDLSMDGNPIKNLEEPFDPGDAVNLEYLEETRAPRRFMSVADIDTGVVNTSPTILAITIIEARWDDGLQSYIGEVVEETFWFTLLIEETGVSVMEAAPDTTHNAGSGTLRRFTDFGITGRHLYRSASNGVAIVEITHTAERNLTVRLGPSPLTDSGVSTRDTENVTPFT